MSAQACGVLRWTWRSVSLCSPLLFPVKQQAALVGIPRLFCSAPPPPKAVQHPEPELTMRALAEMGFSETQAEVVYEVAKKKRCKHQVPILTSLFVLGFNPDSMLKVLEKCPDLYVVKESQLQQRIANLRKLGLLEGSLQRVISHYPQILSLPIKKVNAVSRLLREKCQFTVQQVTDILRDSPHILQEDHTSLEYVFQYAYFRMGCQQAEMVKAKLFRLSVEELQCRHGFLERRGLYQTPDKKGQTLIVNPKLKDFLPVSEETFLTKIALSTQEEFDVFRKLLARELEEERGREHTRTASDEGSDEEGDKSGDYDEETKEEEDVKDTGYNKRRKQRWEP
uniref:Mitochondrial transcription termination factor 4 n=1 Tax=Astyanax mexicanus TaxID=7994 RepID=A0A3B1II46_ASTMX